MAQSSCVGAGKTGPPLELLHVGCARARLGGEDPRNRSQRQRWFESARPFLGRQTTAQLCTKRAARPVDDGLGEGGQLACSRKDSAGGRPPGVGPVKARAPLRPARDGGGLSPSPRTVCRCRARWVGRPSASPGDTRRKRLVVWQPFSSPPFRETPNSSIAVTSRCRQHQLRGFCCRFQAASQPLRLFTERRQLWRSCGEVQQSRNGWSVFRNALSAADQPNSTSQTRSSAGR